MSRHVEQRRPLRRVDLVLPQRPLAATRVDAPDLESELHQRPSRRSSTSTTVAAVGGSTSTVAPKSESFIVSSDVRPHRAGSCTPWPCSRASPGARAVVAVDPHVDRLVRRRASSCWTGSRAGIFFGSIVRAVVRRLDAVDRLLADRLHRRRRAPASCFSTSVGVSPIRRLEVDARASLPAFAVSTFSHCLPLGSERSRRAGLTTRATLPIEDLVELRASPARHA